MQDKIDTNKLTFFKNGKTYYTTISGINYRIRDRYGNARYISMRDDSIVTYKSDGIQSGDNMKIKIPLNAKITKEIPMHIKKSLAYYLTVDDNRRQTQPIFKLM